MRSWIAPSKGGYSGQGEPSTPPGPPPRYPAPVTGQTPPTPSPSEYPPLPAQDDPPPPTEVHPPPLDPDCLAGKHRACLGRAWDEELDAEVECACGCHEIQNVVASL